MRTLRRLLKSLLAASLYYSGVLHLLARRHLRRRCLVLTYHRVMPAHRRRDCHSSPAIVVHDTSFRKHLELLTRLLPIVDMAGFLDFLEQPARYPRGCCLLTFDDGWVDNYEYALPLLRERAMPATVFLPFDYIGRNECFWQEEIRMRLTALLNGGPAARLQAEDLTEGEVKQQDDIEGFVARLKQQGYEHIETVRSKLRAVAASEPPPQHYNRHLNWNQVAEMQAAGIGFESHGLSHRILTRIPQDEARNELQASRRLLETRLGTPVRAIAYPNGDSSPEIEQMAAEAGYQVAFSTRKGLVDPNSPRMALPRVNMHEQAGFSRPVFLCTLLGIL
ncbi:MAG TPA: polysaccharide deacetylase family protein [Gammaproteobacteria bacterium]|nr:polysaccharide deacetylase family protein [Gammaproteobacteria bacterium]